MNSDFKPGDTVCFASCPEIHGVIINDCMPRLPHQITVAYFSDGQYCVHPVDPIEIEHYPIRINTAGFKNGEA